MSERANNDPRERLRHHVTGAIERGEAEPIVAVSERVEHTPGPWEDCGAEIRDEHGTHTVVRRDTGSTHHVPIAIVLEGRTGARDANARLIAAAPDMLQALDELIAEADNGHHEETGALVMARDAFAKATGTETTNPPQTVADRGAW